ncbi:NAD-binding protein [Mycoplasmopsis cynos]|uniref:NAD-binding protein n=1 Tax=Mycoplasmopsis cynos TaxID=171284 RepID=UPI0021FB634F|nr:NAD-binding protein [Mycoplasmopsis cynos]UWV81523.1 NAD-binding protein [Mycoplasmopsis cynos]
MKVKFIEDIAVIGAGRFGQAVVDQLLKLGKTVTFIDKDEEKIKSYKDDIENLIVGDAVILNFWKLINWTLWYNCCAYSRKYWNCCCFIRDKS